MTNSQSKDLYKEWPKTLNTGNEQVKCKLSNGKIHRFLMISSSLVNVFIMVSHWLFSEKDGIGSVSAMSLKTLLQLHRSLNGPLWLTFPMHYWFKHCMVLSPEIWIVLGDESVPANKFGEHEHWNQNLSKWLLCLNTFELK